MGSRKVIAAGHICLDITPVFPADHPITHPDELLVPGSLIHMGPAQVHTGGSVANTGLALKILGSDVTLMGKIGDDAFGKLVSQILAQHGAGGLLVDGGSSTSYSVVLAMPGIDRIFLHDPGANDTFVGGDIPEEALCDAVLFHFGYPPLMKQMYQHQGAELAAILERMKEKGIATSLDFASIDPHSPAGRVDWERLLQRVLPLVDFFVPSFEELCFMLRRADYERLSRLGGDITSHLDMERDVKPLAHQALALGCGAVLIKCGTAGMYYRTGAMTGVGARLGLDTAAWAHREGHQPCFQAEQVRSATGAGDASIAAFLTALLRGKTCDEAVALAAAEGACAVTSYDALSGLLPLEVLEEKIASGWATWKGEASCWQP